MKLDKRIICGRCITLFIHHPEWNESRGDWDSNLLIKPAAADVPRVKITL